MSNSPTPMMNLTPKELESRIQRMRASFDRRADDFDFLRASMDTMTTVLVYDALKSIASGNGGALLANSVLNEVEVLYQEYIYPPLQKKEDPCTDTATEKP